MLRAALVCLVLVGPLSFFGCAAVAIAPAAVGAAAVSGGAGGLVKAGTEYTLAGAAYRTFSASVKDVYEAVHETFHRLEITLSEESARSRHAGPHAYEVDGQPARHR